MNLGEEMSITPIIRSLNQSDEHEVEFLKSELALSLTFSVLAALKYDSGYQQSAEQCIIHADEASSTVFQFLSDPKLYKRLTDEGLRELTLEAERVKKRLEVIRRNRSNRTVI